MGKEGLCLNSSKTMVSTFDPSSGFFINNTIGKVAKTAIAFLGT